jgi:thiol-disulfide isomerase/thioredoxin
MLTTKFPLTLALLIGWCLIIHAPGIHAIDAGQPAPEIAAITADGKSVHLSELRGKTVYLDFWASWCGPCRQSFPWMNAMHDKYATSGLTIVAVNVDQKRADADKFLAQFPAKFAIAYDAAGASPKSYGIKAMPTSLLIDRDGKIVQVHGGFRSEDRDVLEARLRAALGK